MNMLVGVDADDNLDVDAGRGSCVSFSALKDSVGKCLEWGVRPFSGGEFESGKVAGSGPAE
ncbi:hypothetical protein AB0C02_33225, partial [Micromonospora sp. NPDC048999]|uniref:hypothetical protein n=1 Tax=Micromonospora sp. NPDC048999 TaxID=3155391 RepID=UPI0033F16125